VSYSDDDTTAESWKRSLIESRQQARDALSECASRSVSNRNAVNVPPIVQFLHAQTIDYWRHVRPKRQGILGGLWEEQITTVTVPKGGIVEQGQSDWYGNYDVGDLLQSAEWVDRPVTLGNLGTEWVDGGQVQLMAEFTHRATRETMYETQTVDIHLPPAACDRIISQLDDCLEDLRWLPEAGEIVIGEEEAEQQIHK